MYHDKNFDPKDVIHVLQLALDEGQRLVRLTVLGNQLAEKVDSNYGPGIYGIDAVHAYLIHKYNYAPQEVRMLPLSELEFLLSSELHTLQLPVEYENMIQKHFSYR